MLIRKLGISNMGPIREPVEMEFDPHINVLIGPNSCGKTTILNILRFAESGVDLDNHPVSVHDSMWHREQVPNGASSFFSFVLLADGIDYALSNGADEDSTSQGYQPCGPIPMVFVPSIRLTFPPADTVIEEYTVQDAFPNTDNMLDFRRVFRMQIEYERQIEQEIRMAGGYVNKPDQPDASTMLATIRLARESEIVDSDDIELDLAWAEETVRRSWDPGDIVHRKQAVMAAADRCASEICREIMRGAGSTTFEYKPPSGRDDRGITGVEYDHWGISTYDKTPEPLTVGDLSSGTQGPLMWLRYVSLLVNLKFIAITGADKTAYVRERSPWEIGALVAEIREASGERVGMDATVPELWKLILENGSSEMAEAHYEWRKMPFVLLIDEIENHLHPTWQRRIIPALREFFPNAQIFATTHSPFVVAGLKAGQVHKLYRDEGGNVRCATNADDVVGWSAEEILREFMEVPDPTDEATAIDAMVLRWLRTQGRPSEELTAAEWIQAAIDTLSGDNAPTLTSYAIRGWLQDEIATDDRASDWWVDVIDELEDRVSPTLEYHGRVNAERELYVAQLEGILRELEERYGEDYLQN